MAVCLESEHLVTSSAASHRLSARAVGLGLIAALGLTSCGLYGPAQQGTIYGQEVPTPARRIKGKGGPDAKVERAVQQAARTVQLPPIEGLPTNLAALGYRWPVAGTAERITSPYGWRKDPITRARSFHHGLDIGCWAGEGIGASQAGTIVWAGEAQVYGNAVLIAHDRGLLTLYGHLRDLAVGIGERVPAGRLIGTCGSTGRSNGPHLHFEIRHGTQTVHDPLLFLP